MEPIPVLNSIFLMKLFTKKNKKMITVVLCVALFMVLVATVVAALTVSFDLAFWIVVIALSILMGIFG